MNCFNENTPRMLKPVMEALRGKTIMITGATGLIGSALVKAFLHANEEMHLNIKIIAMVRNSHKAQEIFGVEALRQLELWVSDICDLQPQNKGIHYIIHAANQTSSKAFIDAPVDTIMTAIQGTQRMLELARANPVESFVFLSTMEVYGCPQTDEKIYENHPTNLNAMEVRSCYPESKRMCENLCVSYCSQYQIPVKIVRLTQTFGQGVQYHDKRVFAEFARCAIEGKNIILNTKGETKRNYLYVDDAVTAILTVLLKGENGKAYNAANEDTYCSIYDMARLVAEKCADGKISVIVREKEDAAKLGYAPTLKMNLAADALKNLGWEPHVSLEEAYRRLIAYMKTVK